MFLLMNYALAAAPAILKLEQTTAPEGISARWTVNGCNLDLRLENNTTAPIELDWMRSTYVVYGAAVPLVPGSSSKLSSMISIPPMVVPPGSYAQETLFRKDRLPSDGTSGCLFDTPSTGSISLAIGDQWLTQAVRFEVDTSAICRQKKSELKDSVKTERTWGWIAAGTGVGLGAIGLLSGAATAASGEPGGGESAVVGLVFAGIGAGVGVPLLMHATSREDAGVPGCR